MEKTDHKPNEKVEDRQAAVAEDGDVYFFNPWDEQFRRDFKPPQTEFEF